MAYEGTAKYTVGDLIWYLAPCLVPWKPKKITRRWTGPWKVAPPTYTTRSPTAKITKVMAHIRRLLPYTGNITANHIPADIQDNVDGDEDTAELPPGATGQFPVHQPETEASAKGLMVTNSELRLSWELTMLVTNASHTEKQVSRGACVARASLHHSSPQEPKSPATTSNHLMPPRSPDAEGRLW